MIDMLFSLATYIGLVFIAYKVYQFVDFVYVYYLRPGQDLRKLGEWAVVTGSTDGIGKALAAEVAKKGLNVVLISRTQSKLDKVAAEIAEQSTVQVKTISVDYSKFDEVAQKRVMDVCGSLDIGLLVNNVGMSYEYPEFFENVDIDRLTKITKINCEALVSMTRLLLPQMLANKRGHVCNMSSVGGIVPHQLMVVYGSSKAYVNNFTTNMQLECGGKGVSFSAQMPMYVVSAMSKIRRASLTVPTPAAYARASVKHLGYSGIVSPFWTHAPYAGVLGQLPWTILAPIIDNVHKQIRKKALRKKAKMKKST